MRLLILIATVSAVLAVNAESQPDAKVDLKVEPKPAESVHSDHRGNSFSDGLELMRRREDGLWNDHSPGVRDSVSYQNPKDDHRGPQPHDEPGPVVLRTPGPLPHDGHPDIHAQNKIIADVFSPDFYQPTWVLDYRYLKTGGRDYTRGPGGQILILPKGVRSKEHKEFPDYDAYLEHLRLSRLSEHQHHSHDHGHGHHDDGHRDHGYHGHGHRGDGHRGDVYRDDGHRDDRHGGHGQSMWHRYG